MEIRFWLGAGRLYGILLIGILLIQSQTDADIASEYRLALGNVASSAQMAEWSEGLFGVSGEIEVNDAGLWHGSDDEMKLVNVRFASGETVTYVEETGRIVEFKRFIDNRQDPRIPPGALRDTGVSEKLVMHSAIDFLQAMGIEHSEISLTFVNPRDPISTEGLMEGGYWDAVVYRSIDGIKSLLGGVRVQLSPLDATVTYFQERPLVRPVSMEVRVEEHEALTIAENLLSRAMQRKNVEGLSRSVDMVVTPPNGAFKLIVDYVSDTSPRLVWRVSYRDPRSHIAVVQVYVDAQSGVVIGGDRRL